MPPKTKAAKAKAAKVNEESEVVDAALLESLAINHPFVDGNKRAAFLAVGLFLHLNGYRLKVSPAEATLTMLAVAAGELSEDAFAAWLRQHCAPRG